MSRRRRDRVDVRVCPGFHRVLATLHVYRDGRYEAWYETDLSPAEREKIADWLRREIGLEHACTHDEVYRALFGGN